MASNSIRVGAELFSCAQEHGALMSRSAAQQIEHWARMGEALERAGLSVADAAALLRSREARNQGRDAGDQDPWTFKRQRQARDLRNVQEGRLPGAEMSWFSGGKAKAAKLVDSPY